MSYSESTHRKNVDNFDHLITVLLGFGSSYNPSNPVLVISNLQTLHTNADNAVTNFENQYTDWKNKTNTCEIVFAPLQKLSTRILNMFISSSVSSQSIDDLRSFNYKIHGKRAIPITAETQNERHISVSQRSFTSLIDHFSRTIDFLSNQPQYNPNETDLKIATLQNVLNDMKTARSNSYSALVALQNSRIDRNTILYEDTNCILNVARSAKAYVKATFGVGSPEYALAKVIKFVRVIKKKPCSSF